MAGDTTPGRWEIEYDHTGVVPQALFRMHPDHPDDESQSEALGAMDKPGDNVWIAALSPAIAEPLALVLEVAADEIDGTATHYLPLMAHSVARLILEVSDG